jgi:hypothetical protein
LFSPKREHVKVVHKTSATTTLRRRKALAPSAKLEGSEMSDPKRDTRDALAVLGQIDDLAKSLQLVRGHMQTFASETAERIALRAEIADLKVQRDDLKARVAAGWREHQEMKEAHDRMSAALSGPAALYHEIKTKVNAIPT